MNRREFSKKLALATAAASHLWEKGLASSGSGEDGTAANPEFRSGMSKGFPAGSYTPFGYLDNPYHSWELHQSGVVRSVPAAGMGWYFPAGPGGYFDYSKNSIYRSLLRVGLWLDGKLYFEEDDFRQAGISLTASHHSKNIFTLNFTAAKVAVAASFWLAEENTIVCRMNLKNEASVQVDARVVGIQRLELGPSSWWGRDGVAGFFDQTAKAAVLRSFAAGPVFLLNSDHVPQRYLTTSDTAALRSWMEGAESPKGASTAYYPDPLNGGLAFHLSLEPGKEEARTLFLSRAANLRSARAQARTSGTKAQSVFLEKKSEDDAFWSRAPRLEGDFPDHWRHSWVYDFETLRMMVRRPLGVYKHPWDAMQIQAPRNVLAETSIDMWALSYAAPDVAKTVLLGQFQDALEPNVPCMREGGTMNMVAADGSECGTSLQWCYPFYCIESVYLRTADKSWLAELYPHLAAHLEWTMAERTDSEDWIVAKCSWESGMDASSRFLIKQPTGGELIDFIRVAEIQAAMAHAARSMQHYARLLGRRGDIDRWAAIASKYADKTRQLFHQGWFYDVDSRSGKPIVIPGHREVTQMAPIMCGVATHEQLQAMTPAMLEFSPTQDYWLEWASLVLPYAESMWRAGQRQPLSKVLIEIVDRAYRSMDRRQLEPEKKLGWPGVSCEVWGQHGAYGGEGYGWGATLPAHVIRSIFGFREGGWEGQEQFELGPNIPASLEGDGKSFLLRNLQYRGRQFDLRYSQTANGEFLAILTSPGRLGGVHVTDQAGRAVPVQSAGGEFRFHVKNHALYHVQLSR